MDFPTDPSHSKSQSIVARACALNFHPRTGVSDRS